MTADRIIAGLEAAVRGETGRVTIIVPGAPVGKGQVAQGSTVADIAERRGPKR